MEEATSIPTTVKNGGWLKVGLVVVTITVLSVLGILVQANLVMWNHW